MTLRDYQQKAVEHLLAHKRAMVVAPAGAGKTVIGAEAVKLRQPFNFVWLANTREQVEQAETALRAAGSGQWLDIGAGIVCCMMSRPSLRDVELVITDEAHHCPANVWAATIGTMNPDATLWGLTATPFGEDEDRNDYIKQTFEEFIFIDREAVLAGGHLVPGLVQPIQLDDLREYEDELRPLIDAEVLRRKRRFSFIPEHEHRKRAGWQLTLEHMQNNPKRNAAIATTALNEMKAGEVVIVLVASIQHGEMLAAAIPGSAVIHSKLPAKLRRERTTQLRSGELRCAIATSLMDEGADFPMASVLILAAGGRSATKTIQRAGRVMRPASRKTRGLVYDFTDRGLTFANAQWRARQRTYESLNYEILSPQSPG